MVFGDSSAHCCRRPVFRLGFRSRIARRHQPPDLRAQIRPQNRPSHLGSEWQRKPTTLYGSCSSVRRSEASGARAPHLTPWDPGPPCARLFPRRNGSIGPAARSIGEVLKTTLQAFDLSVGGLVGFLLLRASRRRLGSNPSSVNFLSLFRFKIWWMIPRVGKSGREVPLETQFLLLQVQDDLQLQEKEKESSAESTFYVLLLPVLDGPFRTSLQGSGSNELQFCVESG